MSTKPTGLAAFTGKRGAPQAQATAVQSQAQAGGRKRAQGNTVAMTVRVSRSDWMRLHQLAMAEGISLQSLAVAGLSEIMAKHGLPPITS